MELSYNISYSVAAVIITLALLLIVSLQYSTTNILNKRYRFFVIAALVMSLLNIATVITNDYAKYIPDWANFIFNGLYFFSSAVVAILFFYYIVSVALKEKTPKTRQLFYIVNISILALFGISLIVNNFTGIYFTFVDGKYTHGPAYLAVNITSLLYVFEAIAVIIVKRKSFKTNLLIATITFISLFFLSYVLQVFFFPDTLLSDFTSAIGALIIFFTIETPDYAKLMKTLNELNELKGTLEIQVENRTHELDEEKEAYEELTLETLSSLALMIDAKDHYTNGHSFRVAAYAKGMAKKLNYRFNDAEQLYFAGLIHDVGKVGISEAIITKPGKLTDEEYAAIKAHAQLGGDILKGIRQFKIFEQVARNHHERYDGNGYPDKLRARSIPYEARIVTICDTFDAMTSDRSYRKALSDEKALQELINNKGTQFDPELVDTFLELYHSYPDSIRNHVDELAKEEW